MLVTGVTGLITPLITTHEPPSRLSQSFKQQLCPLPPKKKRTRSLYTIVMSDCRFKQLGDLSALDHDGIWIMQLSRAGEMSAAFSHGPMSATTLRVSC